MLSFLVEISILGCFFVYWFRDYYHLMAELEYETAITEKLKDIAEKTKPEGEVNDLSALASYSATAITKFNKMKAMYKPKIPDSCYELSDDEESIEDDEMLRTYRLNKCAEFLDKKENDNSLSVMSIVTNSASPISPHRHWFRGLEEPQQKIMKLALSKRATNNCTNVQNNLKMYRLVNPSDYCIVNNKKYRAVDLMKVYIQWESDQVIYYANCIDKGSGSRVWHEAVQSTMVKESSDVAKENDPKDE